MTRPTKLTPEVQAIIARTIAEGNYQDVAAQYAGISASTFYSWMAKGEAGRKPYAELLESVSLAHAEAEVRNVGIIETAAEKDWRAASWWLERRHPDHWGNKERREITGLDREPVQIRVVYGDD